MNPNEPAYPNFRQYSNAEIDGMTNREVIAMHLMAGLLASLSNISDVRYYARDAAKAADALIEELNRTKKP